MKIIFLNTWNGKIKDKITEFIKGHSKDTDVFCFQEVYPEMRQLCQELLLDYDEFFAYKQIEGDDFPQASYVRKKLRAFSSAVLEGQANTGLGVNIGINIKGKIIHICNFHGRYRPGHKLDTSERLGQSKGLIEFFKGKQGLKIIGGDFNMLPNTESMRMFSENGYRDLIKEFDVKTTRNQLAWAMYPDNPQYYSDYVFLSPDVRLKIFSVPNLEISDHEPLILEIEA